MQHQNADGPTGASAEDAARAISKDEMTVLRALGNMAMASSTRWQVDPVIALRRIGVLMAASDLFVILDRLEAAGLIGDIIELQDGGVLATLSPHAVVQLGLGLRH